MSDSTTEKKQWQDEMGALWPAIKGSLAKVYKPCIREHCPACARGDKHPAWILSFTLQKRRRVMYVPGAMVAQVRHAIRNGRKIETLLYRTGPDLLRKYRKSMRTAQ